MKQRIIIEQLIELSNEQRIKSRDWWKPRYGDWIDTGGYDSGIRTVIGISNPVNKFKDDMNEWRTKEDCLPLLSIGQMIELLKDKECPNIYNINGTWNVFAGEWGHRSNDLSNSLWEVVKKAL